MFGVVETQYNGATSLMIARIVVEQQNKKVVSVDFIDHVHALSGRFDNKKAESWSAQGTQPEANATKTGTQLSDTISIKELLNIVNRTHQGFLSDNGSSKSEYKKSYLEGRISREQYIDSLVAYTMAAREAAADTRRQKSYMICR